MTLNRAMIKAHHKSNKHDKTDKRNEDSTCTPIIVQTRTKLNKKPKPEKETATKDVKNEKETATKDVKKEKETATKDVKKEKDTATKDVKNENKKVDTKDMKHEKSQNTKRHSKSQVKDETVSAREDSFFNTAQSDWLKVYLRRREWEYTPQVPTILSLEPPERKFEYSPTTQPETVEQVIDNYLQAVQVVERDLQSKSLSIGLPTLANPDPAPTPLPVEVVDRETLVMMVSWENLMLALTVVLTMLLLASVPQLLVL